MADLPKLPKVPGNVTVRPPVKNKRYAAIPRGPAITKRFKPVRLDFPGPPPPEFLNKIYHGSGSEWPIYAGLWKYFGESPSDGYLSGPYFGGPSGSFLYQSPEAGGRSLAFGAVADFVIPVGRRGYPIIIRVQSDRFHLTAGPDTVSYDDLQKANLDRQAIVMDAYEGDFLNLRGSNLVSYVADLLSGNQHPDPVRSGVFYRAKVTK